MIRNPGESAMRVDADREREIARYIPCGNKSRCWRILMARWRIHLKRSADRFYAPSRLDQLSKLESEFAHLLTSLDVQLIFPAFLFEGKATFARELKKSMPTISFLAQPMSQTSIHSTLLPGSFRMSHAA